jgi:hypothetical protein
MMRGMMLAVLVAFLSGTALAGTGDSAIGNDTPTADQAQDKAEADTADEAKEAAPFKVPAGYQAKSRGKKTVYCKKSMESGTRFAQERCYSEEQLRAMDASREEESAKLDQTRKVCASLENCSGG